MITSMILGFFANGLYQLLFLSCGYGNSMKNRAMMLPEGVEGNTVDLYGVARALDKLWRINIKNLDTHGYSLVRRCLRYCNTL